MSQNLLFVFAVAASVSLNVLAAFQYLKAKRNRSKPLAATEPQPLPTRPEASLFPEGAAVTVEEVLCPLIEAEVFFAYGRRDDAEAVLAAGLREGRISPDDVSRVRAKLNVERRIEFSPAV